MGCPQEGTWSEGAALQWGEWDVGGGRKCEDFTCKFTVYFAQGSQART